MKSDDTTLYSVTDLSRSIRALVDEDGSVGLSRTWDAYGSQTATTGDATSPFGYAGEYHDSESGLIYLRARYYDPEAAQFLTRDPLVSSTRNAYGYTEGDPYLTGDPSGLDAWCGPICMWLGGAAGLAEYNLTTPECEQNEFDRYKAMLKGTISMKVSGEALRFIVVRAAPAFSGAMGAVRSWLRPHAAGEATSAYRHNYTYLPRIRERALQDPGAHNFPYSFDDVILSGTPVRQADGSLLYTRMGELNGRSGVYEIAVNPETGVIFHRTWRSTR